MSVLNRDMSIVIEDGFVRIVYRPSGIKSSKTVIAIKLLNS